MGLPQLERGCCCCSLETFGYIVGSYNLLISAVISIILFVLLFRGGATLTPAIGGSAKDANQAKISMLINKYEVSFLIVI